ncbi:helix-turn-helix domain-containing protein [Salinisphaera aquimarina]|uniref:Helix-turn-helix domain-containing protein n=1 Tax=Salinisphaera aquimarina TaxID=2094031 RepID=A0ABV7ERZ8_9GAMM
MEAALTVAARALAAGDPLAALNRVALRDDAPALALRGIAMAQLDDFARARALLRRAARAFGHSKPLARARCIVAEAEVALVFRDLGRSVQTLNAARATLEAHGDPANAAHAGYLEARRLLLIGQLDAAEQTLDGLDTDALLPASRAGRELVAAGIAIRRVRALPARSALDRARRASQASGIPALAAEVERASRALEADVARLAMHDGERLIRLDDVEALLASDAVVVDACRHVVRAGDSIIPLATRPVLFALARALAQAWPEDVSRETLLAHVFRAHHIDESHRVRLRVEIGRLRKALEPLARVNATSQGFALALHEPVTLVVLLPLVEDKHANVLALLADGEAWPSSALALALDVSPRTVQRALEALAAAGQVESVGRGRNCRWIASNVPGFPTSLLLPASLPVG